MQAETRFKMKVLKELDKLGSKVWYTKVQQRSKRGDPDIILCVNGRFMAWELKVGNNKVTRLQAHVLKLIEDAGGVSREIHPDNFEFHLEALKLELMNTGTLAAMPKPKKVGKDVGQA
jgi:hypothetical protein